MEEVNGVEPQDVNESVVFDSGQELILKQGADPNLLAPRTAVLTNDEMLGYYMDNGVLMKSVEKIVLDSEECVTRCRIVVISKYRPSLLLLVYEVVFAGHLGRNKTFYWKGMFADVSKHCMSCQVCQIVGNPNQLIAPYPYR